MRDELVLPVIDIAEVSALLVALAVAIWCVWTGFRFLRESKIGSTSTERFLFRRHWGGFGGDSSGWQISPSLASCGVGILLISFGVSLTAGTLVVLHQHEITKPKEAASADKNKKAAEAKPASADDKKALDSAAPDAASADDADGEEEPATVPKSAS
jgi:hypothetical protein